MNQNLPPAPNSGEVRPSKFLGLGDLGSICVSPNFKARIRFSARLAFV